MLDLLKRFKKGDAPIKQATQATAITDNSLIYSARDFGRYNPDDLIGKKGHAIYKKMMLDEQVKAAVKFKRDATTSREFYFEVDDENSGLSDKEIETRLYISEQYISKIKGSWMDVLNYVMSAMYNGFSMTEMIFGQMEALNRTWWTLERTKLRPYDTMYFDTDEFGELLGLWQKVTGLDKKLDYRKFVHFVVNPDVDEWYGQSELREAYRAWFNKDAIIKFRNIWLERHAGGFTIMKPTKGKEIVVGSPEYLAYANILTNMGTSTGMLLPSNMEVEGKFPSNNVAFKEAIEDQDTAIARAILIPNLLGVSPQGQTGAYAQSQTHFEAFLWTLEADARRLEETLNEQLFRLLGQTNFGDDWYPRFKFKPASEARKMELLTLWKDMVGANAVKHSDSDEAHIRDMLNFPDAAVPEDGDATTVTPTSALQGTQVTAVMEVLTKLTAGQITENAARAILLMSFPLTGEQVDEMIKDADKAEPPAAPPVAGGNPGSAGTGNPDDDNGLEGNENSDDETELEETVAGRGLVTVSAFTKALKRVDFAVIDRSSELMIDENEAVIAAVMGTALFNTIAVVADKYDGENIEFLAKLKFDTKDMTALRNKVKAMLKQAWGLGTKHADTEITKAKKKFSADADRLKFIEAKFFDLKSFSVAGKLSDDALAIVKNIILNGAKVGRSLKQVEEDIYEAFISNGLITIDEAPEALADALTSKLEKERGANINKAHRINTMVRTNTFEAINEARYSYFTDPALDDFVQALEYTSVLDSRTTQICEHLDGHTHDTDSEVWDEYRPPNHFNCRSLLIPVTELDQWTESEPPTLEPQKGFK